MPDKVWKDEYYLRSYQLAKSGLGDLKISKALGVTYKTFKRWKIKKRALRNALKDARKKDNGFTTFHDYIFDRLPENLQEVWKELTGKKTRGKYSTVEAMEDLLKDQGKKGRQQLFLYAMVNSNFNPTDACKAVNITRRTLTKWCENEPEFAELFNEIHIAKQDFFEGLLVKGAAEGDANLIKFANSTVNAARGYNPKTVVEHKGTIDHVHGVIPVDELGLPFAERMKLLDAWRERQAAMNPQKAIRDVDEEPEEGDDVIEAEFEIKEKGE